MRTVRLGAGSGFSGDRIEPAVELATSGEIDYLVFECLAERTIALAQLARLENPEHGYDVLLEARMRAVLPACAARDIKIVTNMGAANPVAAARRVQAIAREMGLSHLKIAAITGDDITQAIRNGDFALEELGVPASGMANRIVSANAYLGAEPIAHALAAGADIVITGRMSDPALFLGPLLHEFGWALDDWPVLGRGILAGHLLECAGQITGGYFADPGIKDVPYLARIGFPIGEISENGDIIITKVAGSGGMVSVATCKEQLLYEIGDPENYLQPDVNADFSGVSITQESKDRVAITGGHGKMRPKKLKVSVGYRDGFIGEGQISYAGPGALARAKLAADIVRERCLITHIQAEEMRYDLIGCNALHGSQSPEIEPYEVRLRVSGRCETQAEAIRIGNEVETLYTNGPAAGGGVTKSVKPVIAIASTYADRGFCVPKIHFLGEET